MARRVDRLILFLKSSREGLGLTWESTEKERAPRMKEALTSSTLGSWERAPVWIDPAQTKTHPRGLSLARCGVGN